MGDLPPGSRPQALDSVATGFAREGHQSLPVASSSSPYKSPAGNDPFYSQLSSIPQQQLRPDFRSSAHPHAQYPMQEHGTSPMNMGSMAGALPEYSPPEEVSINSQNQPPNQRSISGASTSAVVYQLGQNLQMPAHNAGHGGGQIPYGAGYAGGHFQQPYVTSPQAPQFPHQSFAGNQSRIHPNTPMQPPYQSMPQGQYMYYQTPYGAQAQFAPAFPVQAGQGQLPYDRRGSLDFAHHDMGYAGARLGAGGAAPGPFLSPTGLPHSAPVSSIPRGPPRKPKQSGHALWVGNLPPGTTVVALKDHFSREATKDIESLFLISKSNCAFVNYRTEASCTAAMHRFHDSRFNSVRLVCRLRRSSAPASGVPTGPSAMAVSQQTVASPPKTPQPDLEAPPTPQEVDEGSPKHEETDQSQPTSASSNKFFIVKSLTLQDLELSVRNGIWATQSHNEDILNKAFKTNDNVYLIFSANKSGEYFGYARMTSPILEDGSRLVSPVPKPENIMDAPDVPKSIPTAATEWAPRGKIIDDSARGTIFWEAELSEPEIEEEHSEKEAVHAEGDNSVVAQSWGKPFKIQWVSTNRLPFYRTRGLRNPWNANREVKIARDGTELEPSVGERLIQMFHRLGPSSAAGPMMPPQHPGGMPIMRPY